jgi:hypothetical protein
MSAQKRPHPTVEFQDHMRNARHELVTVRMALNSAFGLLQTKPNHREQAEAVFKTALGRLDRIIDSLSASSAPSGAGGE